MVVFITMAKKHNDKLMREIKLQNYIQKLKMK